MKTQHVALYARVSSDQQAQTQTIDSQLAALRERIGQDGALLSPEHEFVDAGYSGSTLIRPALEQLRDAVATGEIGRVYVYSPDRLARKYAYQGKCLFCQSAKQSLLATYSSVIVMQSGSDRWRIGLLDVL